MSCYAFEPITEQSYKLNRDGFHVSGKTFPHANMTLICGGEISAEFRSGIDGKFFAVAPCLSGQEAYITVEHEGRHESRKVRVQHTLFGHRKDVPKPHGVPEFSIVTGALSLFAVAGGIAFINRKKDIGRSR